MKEICKILHDKNFSNVWGRIERMLGGNLPFAAPFQSYSNLDFMYENHLVTYTETIQEEQEKGVLINQFYAPTI